MCSDGVVMDAVDQILAALPEPRTDRRVVIAIAGPPAAGKSTLAESLLTRLGSRAGVLGMDAFHYDDAILHDHGTRSRKGAPHTFDVSGYGALLKRLREEVGHDIAVPVFDRSLELTRNSAQIFPGGADTVITEGNWLLLDRPQWRDLHVLFDLTVMLDVAESVIEARTLDRWASFGFDAAEARRRADENDLPNAATVRNESVPAHLTMQMAGESL